MNNLLRLFGLGDTFGDFGAILFNIQLGRLELNVNLGVSEVTIPTMDNSGVAHRFPPGIQFEIENLNLWDIFKVQYVTIKALPTKGEVSGKGELAPLKIGSAFKLGMLEENYHCNFERGLSFDLYLSKNVGDIHFKVNGCIQFLGTKIGANLSIAPSTIDVDFTFTISSFYLTASIKFPNPATGAISGNLEGELMLALGRDIENAAIEDSKNTVKQPAEEIHRQYEDAERDVIEAKKKASEAEQEMNNHNNKRSHVSSLRDDHSLVLYRRWGFFKKIGKACSKVVSGAAKFVVDSFKELANKLKSAWNYAVAAIEKAVNKFGPLKFIVDKLAGLVKGILNFLSSLISINRLEIRDTFSDSKNEFHIFFDGKILSKPVKFDFTIAIDFKNIVGSIVDFVKSTLKSIASSFFRRRRDGLPSIDENYVIRAEDLVEDGELNQERVCETFSRCAYPSAEVFDLGSTSEDHSEDDYLFNNTMTPPEKRLHGHLCPMLFNVASSHFFFENNNFNGSFPDNIGENGLGDIVKTLHFGGNDFSGPIPVAWGERLTNLEWLSLEGNSGVDGSLSVLKNMKKLQYLNIASTSVASNETEHISEVFAEMKDLRFINLQNTGLHLENTLMVDKAVHSESVQGGIAIKKNMKFFMGACEMDMSAVSSFIEKKCANSDALEALKLSLQKVALSVVSEELQKVVNMTASLLRFAPYDNDVTLVTFRVDVSSRSKDVDFRGIAVKLRNLDSLTVSKVEEKSPVSKNIDQLLDELTKSNTEYFEEDADIDEILERHHNIAHADTSLDLGDEEFDVVSTTAISVPSPGRVGYKGQIFCPHGWIRYQNRQPTPQQLTASFSAEIDDLSAGELTSSSMFDTVPSCLLSESCNSDCGVLVGLAQEVCEGWINDLLSALDCDMVVHEVRSICTEDAYRECGHETLEPFLRYIDQYLPNLLPTINHGTKSETVSRSDPLKTIYDTSIDPVDRSSPPANATSYEWTCLTPNGIPCHSDALVSLGNTATLDPHMLYETNAGVPFTITMTVYVASRSAKSVLNIFVKPAGEMVGNGIWWIEAPNAINPAQTAISFQVGGATEKVIWSNPMVQPFMCSHLRFEENKPELGTSIFGENHEFAGVSSDMVIYGCTYTVQAECGGRSIEITFKTSSRPIVGEYPIDLIEATDDDAGIAAWAYINPSNWIGDNTATWSLSLNLVFRFAIKTGDDLTTVAVRKSATPDITLPLPFDRNSTTLVITAADSVGTETSVEVTITHPQISAPVGRLTTPDAFIKTMIRKAPVIDRATVMKSINFFSAVGLLDQDSIDCERDGEAIEMLVNYVVELLPLFDDSSLFSPFSEKLLSSITQKAVICPSGTNSDIIQTMILHSAKINTHTPSSILSAKGAALDSLQILASLGDTKKHPFANAAREAVRHTVLTELSFLPLGFDEISQSANGIAYHAARGIGEATTSVASINLGSGSALKNFPDCIAVFALDSPTDFPEGVIGTSSITATVHSSL